MDKINATGNLETQRHSFFLNIRKGSIDAHHIAANTWAIGKLTFFCMAVTEATATDN